MRDASTRARWQYAGVFFIAQATLMLEVLLTRLTSVTAWYHLAFFVISLAMLGMTAGALVVFAWPERFARTSAGARIASSSLGFALAIPISVALALALPLQPVSDFKTFCALLASGAVLAVPFVLGGVALTLALTRSALPTGLVYGVDLIGAASGCALVVPVLEYVDAPSATLIASAIAALAALCFARAEGRAQAAALLALLGLLALAFVNAGSTNALLRPRYVKGNPEDPRAFMFSRWNTYSRVTVRPSVFEPPVFWAKGRNTPPSALARIEQRFIEIDGGAGTVAARLNAGVHEHAYLSWDVSASAHALRPSGPSAVIGVGGGRDVLEAVRVGHTPVVGIEINDLIVQLHERTMKDYSGLTRLPGVELVADEARSFLARDQRRYEVITMSLIDTWASTGAGAYTLTENGLYTVEAWRTFLARLTPHGIFTVSRWYVVDAPGEAARMLALALETLWSQGAEDPRQHVIMLQSETVATLLVSRAPFSVADVDKAQQLAVDKGFNVLLSPRRAPVHPLLKRLALQRTRAGMQAFARSQALDLSPPTDERPFFFNMLKPRTWLSGARDVGKMDLVFLGNLAATQTLIYATLVSALLSIGALGYPMLRRRHDLAALPKRDVRAALAYFALIGLGFMFVEMALLSRLSVFLGHPTLALSVLLTSIILFTGVGSVLSGRVDVARRGWAYGFPLVPAGLVVLASFALEPVMRALVASPEGVRIVASMALLLPPALGMGLCFPLGLRLSERMEQARAPGEPKLGPWLWGINGAFSVCASGFALGCSMVLGIGATLWLGALCYALLPLCTARLWAAGATTPR